MKTKLFSCRNFKAICNRILNIGWKAGLAFTGLFALILLLLLAYNLYDRYYGHEAHCYDYTLKGNISVSHRGRSIWLYDTKAGKYTAGPLQWVAGIPQRDSLTVFCNKDGKRGFLNVNNGKIVINGRYEHAWVFSEGLAAVVEPDGKMGFIDASGKYVIQPELSYSTDYDYVFNHGVCLVPDEDCKCGLLNSKGEWALPQEYENITYLDSQDMFIVVKDSKYGVVHNGSFESIYPMEYDRIETCRTSSGYDFILYKDFRAQRVALDGTIVDPFVVNETEDMKFMSKYNETDNDEYTISDKVIAFRVCRLWGVMDKHTGKVIIPAMYGSVELASEDIIECNLSINQSRYHNVLYDLNGNKIE